MVADGMGGHKAGEVASLKAVETASEYFTKEGIIQITNDHSVAAEFVRMGKMTKKEIRHSLLRNQLTQALGYSHYLSPEYHEYILSKGDNVLLCSDGLWDMLSDDEIYSIVMEGGTVKEICKNLVDRANEAGGDDNITVLLIKCSSA